MPTRAIRPRSPPTIRLYGSRDPRRPARSRHVSVRDLVRKPDRRNHVAHPVDDLPGFYLRTRKQITCTYTFLGVMVVLCRLPWMSKSRWRESLPRCFPILMSVSDG